MTNKSGNIFLLTINFYKSANNAAILALDKKNPEGKDAVHLGRKAVKKQENTTTK